MKANRVIRSAQRQKVSFGYFGTLLVLIDSGLDFTAQALRRSIENPSEELSVSFTNAYEKTLRKYHSIMVRPIFTVCTRDTHSKLAMKACPYRKDFYAKLGPSEESVRAPLLEWLTALENIVATMQKFYEYVCPRVSSNHTVKVNLRRAFRRSSAFT